MNKNKDEIKQLHNFSNDSHVLYYDEDDDKNLKIFYQMVSEFLDIDNMAGFVLSDDHMIMRYNDVHHLLLDNLFFDAYNNEIMKSTNILEGLREYFNRIKYCCVYPLMNNTEIYGYMIFYRKNKPWNELELKHIESCTSIYTMLVLNINQFDKSHYNQSIFQTMINNINSNIFITNLDTYEILFMNDCAKKAFQIDEPVGKICWKIFQKNQTGPCDNCPIPFLKNHPKQARTWETTSASNKRTYRNYDCLIDWFDHSTVHFQHGVDITEFKQVSYDATYDELTRIYNRKTGKVKLQEQLVDAKNKNKNVIVSLYDLDNLKLTNDVYGHSEGDHMLSIIAETTKKHLRNKDVFFRLSGDEFIVSFYDCSTSQANEIMLSILRELKIIGIKEVLKYELSFCFGLYKVTPNNILSLNEIIMSTDEKMYEWKKKSHLRKAQKDLLKEAFQEEYFEYDEHLLYNALVKSTDDYIFICNMKTGVFKYPPAMVDEFNFPSDILHNAAAIFGSKIHKDDKYEFLNGNQQITDGKTDSHVVEYRALNKNNEWVWLRCNGHVEYDATGEPSIFAGFISNLGKKNYRDILTSLYNKFEFEDRITQAQGEFSIMLLNIDDFKSINSLFDREFGDNILRIIGQNLQTILAKDATVFKLDGDEFGLFIKKSNKHELKSIFQKIQTYVLQQHSYEDKNYSFSITGGCASAPIDGDNYLKLQRNCEIALQYGKHKSRGKLTIFNERIFTEKTYLLQLLNILKQNMSNDFENFSLVYQPIIDTNDKEIMKVEALCRWNNSKFNNIGPGFFIPLLEDTGDIIKLGKWIFESAVKQVKEWLSVNSEISVSINVSYIQLMEDDFVSFVEDIITHYEVPFEHIVIELTETSIAKNTGLIIERIRSLRSMGIKIAMDDFGTGYSSLSFLKDEPFDIIKIDQSFVRGIENDPFNQTFIKLIIELCHQIHLYVLIEGVETEKELEMLLPLKPDFIQGYYTGMPMPTHELVELIKKKKS